MASGSFQSGTSYSCYAYINWSSTAGTGGSSVSASLYFKAIYRYNFTFRNGYTLGINNNNISGNGVKVTSAGDWHLLSHTVWVSYTGNCSVGISGNANCTSVTNSSTGNKLPNYTVGGVAALDKVGEKPSTPIMSDPTDSTISEASKSIKVVWSKSSSYNGKGSYHVDVSIDGGSWSWVSGDIDIGTTNWTYTIPDSNSQGTTYRFRVSCGNDVGWSDHSYSGTVTINKLGVGAINVQNVFNPFTAKQNGDNAILPVSFTKGTQTLNGDLFYKAQLYYGNKLISPIFSSAKNGIQLDILLPPSTYVDALGNAEYAGMFTIKAWVENLNGTKSNTTQTNFKVDINTDGGATPILDGITITGGAFNNPSTCFIAHESTLSIKVGKIAYRRAPSKEGALTYYISIKNNNEEISKIETASIECWQSGTFTLSVTVSDSRGLSTIIEKQYVVQPYTAPRIAIKSSGRNSNTNTNVVINYSIYYSPIYQYTDVNTKGNQLNGISVQQYSRSGGTWTNYSTGKTISGVDANYSYTFEIRIADKFKTTSYVVDNCIIPTIKSLMSIRSYGVGFGCIPQVGHSLEVGGNTQLNNNLAVNGTTSLNELVQIRSGTDAANKRLLDFGWKGSTAKHSIVLEGSGSLRFTAYPEGSSVNAMYISEEGEITADTIHNKLINVSGTIRAKNIQDYGANPIKVGLLAASESREWIGLYDVNAPATRYFWMGRNKDTNKKFYFSGEPTIEKFVFNKPISFPVSTQLVDNDKGKAVTFSIADSTNTDLIVDSTIITKGTLYVQGDTNCQVLHTYNDAIRSMQWGNDSHSYIHTNTNAGAYGISVWASDHRLKENISEIYTPALDMITKIRHVEFDWKADGSHVGFGYVADELQEVYSDFVFEVGEEKRKHINSNVLIPVVTKAIQEQQREIECCYDNMGDLAKEVLDLKREFEKLKK